MKRNNKGIALMEMIVVLALIAIISPLILNLFLFAQETFVYNNKFIAQQYVVTNTMAHIRGDIQSAASVQVTVNGPFNKTLKLGYYFDADADPNTPPTISKFMYWRFYSPAGAEGMLQNSGLIYDGDPITYSVGIPGLDISECKFEVSNPRGMLVISIKPTETNTGKAVAKNVREAIITEISVSYKNTTP